MSKTESKMSKSTMKFSKTQVVTATYTAVSRFRIPDGIDLDKLYQEDKAGIKWDVLYICIGEKDNENDWIKIKPHREAKDEIDWKRGADFAVEDYDEDLDEDEEESDEDEEEDSDSEHELELQEAYREGKKDGYEEAYSEIHLVKKE